MRRNVRLDAVGRGNVAIGRLRDLQGNYELAFYLTAGLRFAAALLCANVRKRAGHGGAA